MKKTLVILMVLMVFASNFCFASANTNNTKLDHFRFSEITEVPAGIIPIVVSNDAEMISVLAKLRRNSTPVLSITKQTTSTANHERIGTLGVDTTTEDNEVYMSNTLFKHNVYSSVTYNISTKQIDNVTNLYSDITGYTSSVDYSHVSNFNKIVYSTDRKSVTITTGGHFTYYFLVNGAIKMSEDNQTLTYKYSTVTNSISNVTRIIWK